MPSTRPGSPPSSPRSANVPRRRRLRATAPARGGDPVGALLPRLPVRPGASHAAPCRPRPAQLRSDALLERELRGPARGARAVSARHGRDHERGSGVVEASPARGPRDRVRATRRGPPLARVHGCERFSPLLRLRRFRRSCVCERSAVVSGRAPREAGFRYALGRDLRGSGAPAADGGCPMPPSTSRPSSRASSSASAIGGFRSPSSDGSPASKGTGGTTELCAGHARNRGSAWSTTISSRRRSEARSAGCAIWRSMSPRPGTT